MKFNIFKRLKHVFTKRRSRSFVLPTQLSNSEKKILTIIDEEIAKSAELGLKISDEHQLKEKYVILLAVQELENIRGPKERLTFGVMMQFFHEAISRALEDESQYYFENLKKEGRTTTMYQVHLHCVASRILDDILNDRELNKR